MNNYLLRTKTTYDWYLELKNSKIDEYITMEYYLDHIFIRLHNIEEQVYCDYFSKHGIFSTKSVKFKSRRKFLKVIK